LKRRKLSKEMELFNQHDYRAMKLRNFRARHDGRITEEHISTFMEACAYVDAPRVIVLSREGLTPSEFRKYSEALEALSRRYGFEIDIHDQTYDGIVEILEYFRDGYNKGALDAPGWY